jgi:hypothetical protein
MKKHLKLLSLLSLLVIASTTFFIFAKRPADDRPETVMVKRTNGVIETYLGNNQIEKSISKSNQNEDVNEDVIETIQKLNTKGYKVISQSELLSGSVKIETWVLTLK